MVVNQLMPPLDDDMATIPAEVTEQLKALDAQHHTHLQVTLCGLEYSVGVGLSLCRMLMEMPPGGVGVWVHSGCRVVHSLNPFEPQHGHTLLCVPPGGRGVWVHLGCGVVHSLNR